MKTILEELYDGHIFPGELIVPKDPEYRPLNKQIAPSWKRGKRNSPQPIINRWNPFCNCTANPMRWKLPLHLYTALSSAP
jgi:hypothetical protein